VDFSNERNDDDSWPSPKKVQISAFHLTYQSLDVIENKTGAMLEKLQTKLKQRNNKCEREREHAGDMLRGMIMEILYQPAQLINKV
jgi:hypothetical protein